MDGISHLHNIYSFYVLFVLLLLIVIAIVLLSIHFSIVSGNTFFYRLLQMRKQI